MCMKDCRPVASSQHEHQRIDGQRDPQHAPGAEREVAVLRQVVMVMVVGMVMRHGAVLAVCATLA